MIITLKYWIFDNYRTFFNIYLERQTAVKLKYGFYASIFDHFIKKGKLNFSKTLRTDRD